MDYESSNVFQVEAYRNISLLESAQIIKCPHCHSVYIDDGKCEDCGINLSFNPFLNPVDEKSFYSLMECERKRKMTPLYLLNLSFKSKRLASERFQNKLLHRLDQLISYFCFPSLYPQRYRSVFLMELRDLIAELLTQKIPEKILWSRVDEICSDLTEDLVTTFYRFVYESMAEAEKKREKKIYYLDREFFGVRVEMILRPILYGLFLFGLSCSLLIFLRIKLSQI